jgi:signal transduction histidine kinase
MSPAKLSAAERTLLTTAAALLLAAGAASFALIDGALLLPGAVTLGTAVIVAALSLVAIRLMRRSAEALRASYAAIERANRDLERRLAERAANLREADDEVRHLADVIERDLRTPLGNIMGFTGELEALRNGMLARKGAEAEEPSMKAIRRDFDEALWFIRSSVAKVDRLIAAILDLSQIARRDLKAEVVDLDRLARSLATDLTHRVDRASIRLAVGKLPTIVGDRAALEQIFSHLLDNAAKFLRDDLPGHIRIGAVETEAGMIEIAIADNGRGIAPEDQARVFDLFRRAGAQTRPGEGIGLAVVRTLVRRLGGSIRLESEIGRGSTFTIVLPKAPA